MPQLPDLLASMPSFVEREVVGKLFQSIPLGLGNAESGASFGFFAELGAERISNFVEMYELIPRICHRGLETFEQRLGNGIISVL